jgi:outer membrane lipoprotein SlyB
MRCRLAAGSLLLALLMVSPTVGIAQPNAMQKIRYASIVSLEQAVIEVQAGNSGTQAGATVGAVAGYALSSGRDRWLGALVGGALGGAAGKAADRSARKKKGWQLIVRLEENGEEIGVQVVGKKTKHQVGDRVRLLTGPNGQTQVSSVKD